ncbi:MAG: class I SAM-dependent methyltransferase [Chloroflexota bacterium]
MIHVHCDLCGRDDWTLRFPTSRPSLNGSTPDPDVGAFRCTSASYGHHLQIVQCRHCGFVYATPRWEASTLLAAYSQVEDHLYLAERAAREMTFGRHLRALERIAGPAGGRRLLDVGAYIGVFVEVAQQAGWQAWGVEPSAWAVQEGRRRGLTMIHGTQRAPELQNEQFDAITLWDVIEHLPEPSAELAASYRLLKPGGWLAVHTMDVESWLACLMGRRWPWLMDMHLQFFSQRTLRLMLLKNGFQVVWSGAQGRYLRLGYLASRLEGLNRPLGRLTQTLVHHLGLAKVAALVNFGDLFTVYARK